MCSEDDRTKKKKDDKSDKNNQRCDMITAFYCAFIVLEAVLTAVIAANVKTIGDKSLVLAFMGVLATFVVISNYAQLLEVKHKTNGRLNILENKILQSNLFDESFKIVVDDFIKLQIASICEQKHKKIYLSSIDSYRFIEKGKMIVGIKEAIKEDRDDAPGPIISDNCQINYYLVDFIEKDINNLDKV